MISILERTSLPPVGFFLQKKKNKQNKKQNKNKKDSHK